jgi:hypothetical protein
VAVGSLLGAANGFGWYLLCKRSLLRLAEPWLPTGKAPLHATVGLLVIGAAAVGSVERRIKQWWAPRTPNPDSCSFL